MRIAIVMAFVLCMAGCQSFNMAGGESKFSQSPPVKEQPTVPINPNLPPGVDQPM